VEARWQGGQDWIGSMRRKVRRGCGNGMEMARVGGSGNGNGEEARVGKGCRPPAIWLTKAACNITMSSRLMSS
jgi:hypothetical protein